MEAASERGVGPVRAAPNPPKRRRGPRPKHVPIRMCVACREQSTKRALTRIVRTPDGTVQIDPTGKQNGRGAYLCDRPACWEKALKTGMLSRALNATLTPETVATLRAHAATLESASRSEPQAALASPGKGT